MSKRILFSLFFTILFSSLYSQLENKLTTYAYTGLPLYNQEDGGQAFRNVFNGYKPIPYIGFGLDYGFNNHFVVGPNIRFMRTSKANVSIPNVTIGIEAKYNILPNDKKISPFIVSEASVTNLSITQDEVVEVETINNKSGNQPYEQSVTKYTPSSVTKLSLIPGVTIGTGIDFTLKKKYGVFVSFNYMFTNAHNHAKLIETYSDNTSKYSYFLIKAGLNFGFLRSKKI